MKKTTPRLNTTPYEFAPITDERRYRLSAPEKSGYSEIFIGLFEVQRKAAMILGIPQRMDGYPAHGSMLGQNSDVYARAVAAMIEVESPDGGTTYCYATQADADADKDGANAVQYKAGI